MSIQSKVKIIVDQLTGTPAYIGGSWYKLNQEVEKATLPVVMYISPVTGRFFGQGMQLLDSPRCMIAFMDKVTFVSNFDDENEVTDRMKLMCAEFIAKCNASGMFDQIKDVNYEMFYDKLDVNLIGIVLDVNLKEKQGVNICNYQYIDESTGTVTTYERDPVFIQWLAANEVVTQYTINNGDTLPTGLSPDILYIDTGVLTGDYSAFPYRIEPPSGYFPVYADLISNVELSNFTFMFESELIMIGIIEEGEKRITFYESMIYDTGNISIQCTGNAAPGFRCVVKYEKSRL